MSLLGNLTVGILGNIGGLSDSFSQAQNQVRQFGRQMQNIGSDLSAIGGTLTAGLTLPIIGLGSAAVKSSIEFESAFAGVIKTVDATEEELAGLRQGILDMSKEIPSTANEIASVAEAAGQLGIEVPNILAFTRVMSDLGVATNMGSQEAAMSLARLANITQMPQTEFDRLGSTIVHLGNNLATTEAEITEFGLRIAGAGAQIGLTESEILAFGGALSSVGINAEAGGTAISRVMVDLANAVALGGEDLASFAKVAGMSSAEFKKAFETDAASAIVTFIEGLGGISEAGGNTFKVLEDLGMSDIRVRDALLRSAGAGDLLREALELGNGAWEENNALTKEAEARYATTESQLQILKNRLDDVLGTIGDALVPALMSAVTAMEPLFQMIEKTAAAFYKLDPSIQVFTVAIAAIAAAIGPVLVVLGLMISSIGTISTAFAGLSGAIAGAGGAIAILTGPIGLTVAAVVGLGAALIALWNNSETFRTSVTEIFNNIKNAAVQAFGIVASFIGEKITQIKAFWDASGPQFLAAVENVFNGIKAVIDFVMPAVLFVVEMAWTAIKQVIDGALNVIMGLIKVFSGLFTGDFSTMWEGIKQIFSGAIDLIIGLMTLTFVGGLRTLLTNLAKLGVNLVKGLADGIVGLFKTFTTTGSNLAKAMVDGVLNFFRNLYSSASSIFTMLRNFGAKTWEALKQTVVNIAQQIWQLTVQRFTNMVNSIRNVFGTVLQVVKNIWGTVMAFFKGIDLKEIGKNIIQGLVNGIGSMASAVWEKVKEITNGIPDTIRKLLGIHSPSRVTTKLGEFTAQGLIVGMDKSKKDVEKSAKGLADSALEPVTNALTEQITDITRQAKKAGKTAKDQAEKIKKEFNEAMAVATNKYKVGKLDTSEYIKSLEAIKFEFGKTAEQLRKVDSEITKFQAIEKKERIELMKKEFDASKKYIEDKKYYNEMSLAEELAAWERVQSRYMEGTEERIQADREVYRVKQEITNKLTSLNDEYTKKISDANQKLIDEEKALTDEYKKAVESRTNALYSFAGLFDEINNKTEVSGQQLVNNLKGQVKTFAEWSQNIKELAAKGIDEGLLAELQNMGPKAYAEIAALTTLTDEQLSEYSDLWLIKNEQAKTQAVGELEGLRMETENKINALHAKTAEQLEMLKMEWINKVYQIRQGTEGEFNIMSTTMPVIGKNAMQGLLDGMVMMEGSLMAKARQIARDIKRTIQDALDINSPSRVMRDEVGKWIPLGLAEGIESSIGAVIEAASKMADATLPDFPNVNIPAYRADNPQGSNSPAGVLPGGFNPTIHNYFTPAESTPSESARKQKQMLQQAALNWGF